MAPAGSFTITARFVAAGKVSVTVAAAAATVPCEFCALKVNECAPAPVTVALKPPFGSTDSVANPEDVTLAALTVSG